MDRYRTKLDGWLREICANVYFQPPPNLQLKYPCAIYRLSSEDVAYASNIRYKRHKVYEVIVVDRNPDTDLPDKVAELPYCGFSRSYQADGLNHYAYTIHI